jgi:hypothetical protein
VLPSVSLTTARPDPTVDSPSAASRFPFNDTASAYVPSRFASLYWRHRAPGNNVQAGTIGE